MDLYTVRIRGLNNAFERLVSLAYDASEADIASAFPDAAIAIIGVKTCGGGDFAKPHRPKRAVVFEGSNAADLSVMGSLCVAGRVGEQKRLRADLCATPVADADDGIITTTAAASVDGDVLAGMDLEWKILNQEQIAQAAFYTWMRTRIAAALQAFTGRVWNMPSFDFEAASAFSVADLLCGGGGGANIAMHVAAHLVSVTYWLKKRYAPQHMTSLERSWTTA